MTSEFYRKLVDLYAGEELPEELTEELEAAALKDSDLSHEMFALRKTLQLLKTSQDPVFTEESYQRILLKMRARGAELETKSPESPHWQYQLPMQG
jgi:hypothetical protein